MKKKILTATQLQALLSVRLSVKSAELLVEIRFSVQL